MKGKVYLVGAGPGDPELITVKGARLLREAEVIVYDFLVNTDLLKLASKKTELIYVGKKSGNHIIEQTEINNLLCNLANRGLKVLRLKGGDPFIFGRGGEEASALIACGLDFEIVPGITSAIAAPAYAGIPITDRRYTTEVAFVTGHISPDKHNTNNNWASLAGLGTIIFLMGAKNIVNICQQLIAHGKPPNTPIAVIRWGTTAKQQTIVGTLVNLPEQIRNNNFHSPVIIIVGQVVELRNQLRWFDRSPLFGRRILITRATSYPNKLSENLKQLGALIIEVPTIALKSPNKMTPLLTALKKINVYKWILFTSSNGVFFFIKGLKTLGKDIRALFGILVGAIGPGTAETLRKEGIIPDLIANTYILEGLLEALAKYNFTNAKVLIPRAEQARDVLANTLRNWGAKVDVVSTYQIITPSESGPLLRNVMQQGVDIITFTASSTVVNFMDLLDAQTRIELCQASKYGSIIIASIGPITSHTAQKKGLTVHIQPEVYTIDALVEALLKYFIK